MLIMKTLSLTTDGAGAASATARFYPSVGRLVGIRVADAQFDDNYDLSITDALTDTIFSKAAITGALRGNINSQVAYQSDDGAASAAETNGAPLFKSPLTITIANGGNAQTGVVRLFFEA